LASRYRHANPEPSPRGNLGEGAETRRVRAQAVHETPTSAGHLPGGDEMVRPGGNAGEQDKEPVRLEVTIMTPSHDALQHRQQCLSEELPPRLQRKHIFGGRLRLCPVFVGFWPTRSKVGCLTVRPWSVTARCKPRELRGSLRLSESYGNPQPSPEGSGRFRDHPRQGSRAKRPEARGRRLVRCVRWSELHGNMQKGESSDLIRNTTDIPFYTTPTVVLDDFIARKGMATQWARRAPQQVTAGESQRPALRMAA
jgi:hypothetical protein